LNAQLDIVDETISTVDDSNPWIGLASFTEESRKYFYGREDEVAELARRVQRKLLTVLFGQSGLGKTSILRAGLVPRLRGQGYCPVYVRVDYSREAPEPAEQLKQAIARTARRSGQWTQAGVATEGETLWEFLHHRDDVLLDEHGETLIPLLIFDQFEEVFTIAQSDEFGRARAARFIADLADLVENRPPASLESKLEADDTTAERFDFARSDYRVLISLREDYLAPLEGLKAGMPSVTQNRLRLAPMNGKQGLAAVMLPGKKLVTEEVAEAIVRFVAGGSEIANAEVEPSLLSLICRELNDTRKAQGRSEISLDLLAGSHASILSNFYERALADQPAAVRCIIEDELLTDSGFRENIAEERLQRSFAAVGAAPHTLSTLVNRRLLRIEERLDVRRVELTHDVLTGVVKGSRDLRLEREAREATEKQLAEQKDRAQRTRAALIRARQIAAVCIVLAVGAAMAAVFAYISTQRAKRAETVAQESRKQAEQLLGYLTDDFARELESSGRLDVVADLAKREVEYFRALPDELKGPSTTRMGAIALQQYARVSRSLGNHEAAQAAGNESEQLLAGLRKDGDTSEATTIALARAMGINSRILGSSGDPGAMARAQLAVDTLAPLSDKPDASLAVREAEAALLVQLGYRQLFALTDAKDAYPTLRKAMDVAARHGALDLSNLYMAGLYVEASAWTAQAAARGGDHDTARRVGADGNALATRILELRPSDKVALYAQAVILSSLANVDIDDMRPLQAMETNRGAVAAHRRLVALDSGNTVAHNNLSASLSSLSDIYWSLGRIQDAIESQKQAIASMRIAAKTGPTFKVATAGNMWALGRRLAETGRIAEIPELSAEMAEYTRVLQESEPADSNLPLWAQSFTVGVAANAALVRNDPNEAIRLAAVELALIEATKVTGESQDERNEGLFGFNMMQGRAKFLLGDYAGAEAAARASLEARKRIQWGANFDAAEQDMVSIDIALAQAAQNRAADAATTLDPVVKRRREMQSRNHGDMDTPALLASALYAQSAVDAGHRAALLREAAALIDSTTAEFRALYTTRLWRDRISKAQRGEFPWTGRGNN
jgi:conflict system STAND superfamily ATPase/tetratricopeptide repeat protein